MTEEGACSWRNTRTVNGTPDNVGTTFVWELLPEKVYTMWWKGDPGMIAS